MHDDPSVPESPAAGKSQVLSGLRESLRENSPAQKRLAKALKKLRRLSEEQAKIRARHEESVEALAESMAASSLKDLRKNSGWAFSWGGARDHQGRPLGFGFYYRTFLWHEPGDGSGLSWLFGYRIWFSWKTEPDDETLLKETGRSAEETSRRLKASMGIT